MNGTSRATSFSWRLFRVHEVISGSLNMLSSCHDRSKKRMLLSGAGVSSVSMNATIVSFLVGSRDISSVAAFPADRISLSGSIVCIFDVPPRRLLSDLSAMSALK